MPGLPRVELECTERSVQYSLNHHQSSVDLYGPMSYATEMYRMIGFMEFQHVDYPHVEGRNC